MFRLFFAVCGLCVALFSLDAKAVDFFDWQSNNIQVLRGTEYEVGLEDRTLITLEHADAWKYGDNFAFIDIIRPDGGNTTHYMEIAPRLSLSKMTGRDFSYGIIKDVLISTTYEKAQHQGPQYLIGAAVDLDLPDFKFFKVNGYLHDSTELNGQTWQVTIAWNRPFEIAGLPFLTEGFADIQGGEADTNSNELIVPRLLLDVGSLTGYQENRLMMGVEYQYWHNKFGIEGVTESVPQLQVKWIF